MKKSSELLNLYMTSGGTKATYEDVVNATRRENIELKLIEIKEKHKCLYLVISGFYILSTLMNSDSAI